MEFGSLVFGYHACGHFGIIAKPENMKERKKIGNDQELTQPKPTSHPKISKRKKSTQIDN